MASLARHHRCDRRCGARSDTATFCLYALTGTLGTGLDGVDLDLEEQFVATDVIFGHDDRE